MASVYEALSLLGALSYLTSYSLLLLRWHGHTSLLESLYIIPGGFGNGIALSTSFITLTAGVEPCQLANASSGLYLSSNIGMVLGLSLAAAILQIGLRVELRIALEVMEGREQILGRASSDIEYVRSLQGSLGKVITEAYVRCLTYTHGISIFGALVALAAAFCVKEHIL